MKDKKKYLVGGIFFSIFLFWIVVFVMWSNYVSPKTTATRLVTAVTNDDFVTAKKIIPKYVDGSTISEESYMLMFKQMSKTKDISFLLNTSNFETRKTNNYLAQTVFLPKKRYINLETGSDYEKISVFQDSKELQLNSTTLGPLIPYEYTFEFEVDHPTLGKILKKEKVSLETDRDVVLTDRMTFLSDQSFQKKLVTVVSDFYLSYNVCIRKGLDFNSLSSASENLRSELNEMMSTIQPYIVSYSQSFQTVVMDSKSLKIDENQQTVYFDMYIDRKISIELKKEWSDSNTSIQDDSKNAIVALTYDNYNKEWLVSKLDFETYEQKPTDWAEAQQFKLEKRDEATWGNVQKDSVI